MINLNDLIGLPFDEDGYGPDAYSCYGLVVEVFRRYGIDIPKTNISVCACKEASQKEIQDHLTRHWVPAQKPHKIPTGVIIQADDPKWADHLGVYIGDGKLIHITRNRNVVVDRIREWKPRILGYYVYVG